MKEASPRSDLELAEAYNLGLTDLNGKRDGLISRMSSGHDRRLGKMGPVCWAILPASVLTHRASGTRAPAFDELNNHERHGLRYIAIAIEHGRGSISISMATESNGYQPLYYEQALIITDAIHEDRLFRAKDGSIAVTKRKRLGGDVLSHAVDILDVCKETGVEPIPTSPDAPRKASPTPKGAPDPATS
ncbi:hypothetical protein L0664_17115 [Octadecabacter sp. G9-8]|uniref:Uncharacterized protein n=1 Tax=Octadecabacter dasysiphoniae TaxID=2909341 RepID=A0ABS9D2Z3_9RHOB|nr:hypothetical protein [Octadecabacter dasysiphoniae]MCF2872791.1 hypothetical protein [Octadecabacter dasysiphoniae]